MAWLQRQRLLLPEPVDGYVERPELERRCGFLDRRLTVLSAPAGFGKTALLAHCCRRLREDGVCVAWLSLDEEDAPGALATYLQAAFEEAGLEIYDGNRAEAGTGLGGDSDREMDSEAAYRLSVLIAAMERLRAPCLLALDEVERLRGAQAVRMLNVLLDRAPANLHLAMAYRERPVGLDTATSLLAASGATVSAEELRFSEREVARFFDTPLSRGERRTIMKRSAGWPLALRILRNVREEGDTPDVGADTVASWIETRLWRGLAAEDRELVLDMSLFDWFDGKLLDEVLATTGATARILAMRSLTGLLQTTGTAPTMRLHPLIRDYGAARRLRETPDRFRTIHAAIARSLARRGQTVEALHHASTSGDIELTGRIAERTGNLTAVVHEKPSVVLKVVETLKGEIFSKYPRLALTRCLSQALTGDIWAVENGYRQVSIATAGFTHDRPDGDDRALATEHMLLLGVLHLTGCRPHGMPDVAGLDETAEAVASDIDPRVRAVFSSGICVTHGNAADFVQAADWGKRASLQLGARSYLAPRMRYEFGQLAMAEGRPKAAANHYGEGLAMARSQHLRDAGCVAIGSMLKDELAFEQRGTMTALQPTGVSLRLLGESGAVTSVYLANLGVGVQLALSQGYTRKATELVEGARDYALQTRRPSVAKYATALHVATLLADGKVGDATRTWQFDGLPGTPDDCLDIQRRGWRRTEMLASTMIRLCMARGDVDAARDLSARLQQLAAARTLKRTVMRAAALSMVVAFRAGDEAGAMRHLATFVRHYEETGYAAGLAADRDVAVALLERLVDERSSDTARDLATVLRSAGAPEAAAVTALTTAELEVLERVARGEPDKRIATALQLSVDGVRYRLRTAFAKLGVRNRLEAVSKAREAGVMHKDGGASL